MILGTVSAIDKNNGLSILVDGEDEPTKKNYSYASTYVPHVGDRVAIEEISGTYIVMFAIVNNIKDCGISKSIAAASNTQGGTDKSTQIYLLFYQNGYYLSTSGESGSWKKITTS